VAPGFFPLDEELGLTGSGYSPFVHASIVRLGTWLPFERVPAVLGHFTQVPVSAETARRLTEQAGAALEAAETAAVGALEAASRLPPAPPERLQVSVDGAMVPLVHKAWAEVKTLVIGTVGTRAGKAGPQPHAQALSYFSRLADAATFTRLAWVETQRRGVPAAADVCGIVDGADWCQRFLDGHCPDAVRILDWAHAAEYLSAAGRSVFGAESPALTGWLDQQLTELKQGDPAVVLRALERLERVIVQGPDGPHCPRDTALGYLTKRQAQIQYAKFTAAGYPIGSGAVESANKLAVEARLKGSGMHWARANVNPLLTLRGAACSDRWDAAWATLTAQQAQQRATARACRAARRPPAPPPPAAPRPRPDRLPTRSRRATMCHGRPTADHPWRRDGLRPGAPATPSAKI
jgi:hypothetical protein